MSENKVYRIWCRLPNNVADIITEDTIPVRPDQRRMAGTLLSAKKFSSYNDAVDYLRDNRHRLPDFVCVPATLLHDIYKLENVLDHGGI